MRIHPHGACGLRLSTIVEIKQLLGRYLGKQVATLVPFLRHIISPSISSIRLPFPSGSFYKLAIEAPNSSSTSIF